MLRDAYKDINTQLSALARQRGVGAEMRRAQLKAVKQDILNRQAEVFQRTGQVIERRRVQAAARAIRVAGRYDEAVFALGHRAEDARALTDSLAETESRAVDAAIARLTGSRTILSERVYRAQVWSNGRLERRINSALARGLSAEEFAREIRDFVNPATPGGQRYAAMRLARTEINNAYHAMAVQAAMDKPWINAMKWHTSASHPHKDVCDSLRGRLFAPQDVPKKPHPQCLCFATPEVSAEGTPAEDDDAFLDALVGGEFDDYLDGVISRHNLVGGR